MSSSHIKKHTPSLIGQHHKESVWVEFVKLANDSKAVNLGQGFPDSPMPPMACAHLLEIASHPERTDWHQYTRPYGHPRLVNILSKFYSPLLGRKEEGIDAQSEVLVTVGAYLGLYYSFMGWLNQGDEVILIEPAYDSYVSQIRMAGATPIPITLHLKDNPTTSADYLLDLELLESKITSSTKMLVLNNPNNPTGKLYSRSELEGIAALVEKHDLLVVSDEVYEWHIYPDGGEMIRFASLPNMFNRTITIGSAGKCFSATGWKVGWAIGPSQLLQPLKAVHENCIFAAPTPCQEAVARVFEEEHALLQKGRVGESYLMSRLPEELLPKRNRLAEYLEGAGFKPIVPQAGYFMIADFSHLDGLFKDSWDHRPDAPLDYRFVYWLTQQKGLATIPPTAFYSSQESKSSPANDHFIRLCFFKKDETLDKAIDILKQFSSK